MNVFIAVILYCTSVCSPLENRVVVSAKVFETEEECLLDLLNNGVPYVESGGASIVAIDCFSTTVEEGTST